ncbi:MAG: HAD family hydrolase [Oscillospiraceae bacterium]|nr:HAD family hydrolase [Oscillospiraceae bacterium]
MSKSMFDNMNRPKMIIFDYGHTLCHESGFDGVCGTEAILKHAVTNKNNLTAKEVSSFLNSLYNEIARGAKKQEIEIHNRNFEKFAYEYLQIDFDLPQEQIEKIFWDAASPGAAMPDADKVLAYLKKRGIRSGVISNISFGGGNLADRIGRILPDNDFEFIIASSEYMYRKPNKMIFELALRKAGLSAGEVWYCGDSPEYDVAGAVNAGIFPVWYHSRLERGYGDQSLEARPGDEHLYIREWPELIEVLETL